MIIKIFLALVFTLSGIQVFAQEAESENTSQIKEKESIFQPIIIAGFNAAQIEGDDLRGYRRLGANIGGGVHIKLPKDFSLAFELLYSMKGAKSSVDQSTRFADVRISMDYIDVPIYATYTLDNRLIFELGLIANTLVRYKETWNGFPPGYDANRLALEVMGGLTFKFASWFGLNARMSYSLTNINKGGLTLPPPSTGFVRKRSHNVLSLRALFFI